MRFGLSVPPFCAPSDLIALALDAERSGWDGCFLWDHLRFDASRPVDVHDPWVLLGAIAQVTSTLTIGTLVTPLPRRRPWHVAKAVTTLDHLSAGRAALGVGLGSPAQGDFGDFGEPESLAARAALLDEGLTLLDALLRGGPVHHRGSRFSVTSELVPSPVQRPRPPIWVAAVAPHRRPLERARRWDGVAPIGSEADVLTPDGLQAYLGQTDPPKGWEVLAPWAPGVPADEYADVGATWLIESTRPEGDWLAKLRDRVRRGPMG
jgi:alkanesulfonate monooxygenase SsuD/methylene tetrahydromethanopterin reductase-like flavin-dependent oxidoreductase (luciferase family)